MSFAKQLQEACAAACISPRQAMDFFAALESEARRDLRDAHALTPPQVRELEALAKGARDAEQRWYAETTMPQETP